MDKQYEQLECGEQYPPLSRIYDTLLDVETLEVEYVKLTEYLESMELFVYTAMVD